MFVSCWRGLAAAGAFALMGGPAAAQGKSELLFSHKAWEVHVVELEGGQVTCLAQVSDGSRSFSMWADKSQLVQLQFYDESWTLGEGDTADLTVRIDRRTPWELTGADLLEQSVFFNIPDSDDGVRFMDEVMRGNVLYLSNNDGEEVESYSLSGSRAAVGALIGCVGALSQDTNPFN